MKRFKTLYEVWQYCQGLVELSSEEIDSIPTEELASLYCQADSLLKEEVSRLAVKLDLYPSGSSLVCFRKRTYRREAQYAWGDVEIGFHLLFECLNYETLLSIIIHELCHSEYSTHGLEFWQLYERCLKKLGLIAPDYSGWAMQVILRFEVYNADDLYSVPFYKSRGFYNFPIIRKKLFKEIPFDHNMTLRQEYQRLLKHVGFEKSILPMFLHGEHQQQYILMLINYMSRAKRALSFNVGDLVYLQDEKEILCLFYDSGDKRDEERFAYCIEQMKTDKRYDFSKYTSCFVYLEVDERCPLKIDEISLFSKIPTNKIVRFMATYSLKYRDLNVNKCEMIVVLSR